MEGAIGGIPTTFLVDTGSNITVVTPEVYRSIPAPERPVLEEVGSTMLLADGRSLPFTGKADMPLQLGSTAVVHKVWVADIGLDGIIGMDFMRRMRCELTIDRGSYKLTWPDGSVTCTHTQTGTACCRVVVRETVIVPPGTETIVPGEYWQPSGVTGPGVLETAEKFLQRHGLLVARTLVDMGNSAIPLRLLNTTSSHQTVHKGTTVAWCEPVCEVPDAGGGTVTVASCQESPGTREPDGSTKVPDFLNDLLHRSSPHLDTRQQGEVAAILTEFADVFAASDEDLGKTGVVKHRIDTGNARPIRQPARRMPVHQKKEAEDEVQKMLRKDIIEPSSSPWASPIVLVKKKDGSTRFCVDYRKLNAVTTKDSYPLPRIDDSLDALAGSKWFSTLDLKSGYWQVEMEEEDKVKTAFTAGSGLYQFKVMPFGLANAPATFERLMERVLAGLPPELCLVYLDDLIVHGKHFTEELERLRDVFLRLRAARLKLSPNKCHLFQKRVAYLGHIVSEEGVSTDPAKIRSVADWPVPRTIGQVRSFLGLSSYYRRFVRGFADIAKPLYTLTERSNQPFQWTSESEQAFQMLKEVLTRAPVLAYPTREDPFVLDTDASNKGIGAVLSQIQDGQERVVAFYSRVLHKAERRYCVTRKELLGVVEGVRNFHHYLYGRRFLVRTDHGALQWLLNFRNPEGQLARWLEELGTYDMDIQHRSGRQHGNADALSRRPCGTCKHCDSAERKGNLVEGDADSCERSRVAGLTVIPGTTSYAVQTGTSLMSAEPTTPGGKPSSGAKPTAAVPWSNQKLREEQLADKELRPLIEWKEEGRERPKWPDVSPENPGVKLYWAQWDRLHLKDGVLYRRWESHCGKEVTWQLVVPATLRADILQQLHNSKTAGHLGTNKTLAKVRGLFYWRGCGGDVRRWCRSCDLCATRNRPQKTPRAPMKTYNVGAPMERVALDVLGPLPESEQGNRYILVIADYFTKWTESYPMPNQEATTVAKLLVEEFVVRFGAPRQLHSDQGRNFESAVFQEMCRLLDIDKTRTTPLRPQSDGMVERFNRTLEAMLSKFVAENQKDWDELLPFVMMAYRSSVHESTGCSPSEMMLGRNVQLPVELLFSRPQEEALDSPTKYAHQLQQRMERTHDFARDTLRIESDRQKRHYDHRADRGLYDVGDAVWLHNPKRKRGISPKLQRPWEGPYLVTTRISDVVYRIQRTTKAKPKVVHYDRLKPYTGNDHPTWLLPPTRSDQHEQSGGAGALVDSQTPDEQRGEPGALVDSQSSRSAPSQVSARPRRDVRPPKWTRDFVLDT